MTSYPGRWLVTLGYIAWVLCVLYVATCLAAPSLFGDCELTPGSSVLGRRRGAGFLRERRAPTS